MNNTDIKTIGFEQLEAVSGGRRKYAPSGSPTKLFIPEPAHPEENSTNLVFAFGNDVLRKPVCGNDVLIKPNANDLSNDVLRKAKSFGNDVLRLFGINCNDVL